MDSEQENARETLTIKGFITAVKLVFEGHYYISTIPLTYKYPTFSSIVNKCSFP